MTYDYAIVGAGFTGGTCAALLKDRGKSVLVVDERGVIGGTSADIMDDLGYITSLFGPHAFHTNSIQVINFLSRFTEWEHYVQISKTIYGGELYDIPINANTIEKFFKVDLPDEYACETFLREKRIVCDDITNSLQLGLSTMGRELFEAFYWNYTCKQWDRTPDKLHRSVVGRLPVRTSRDNRYFTDAFQKMPKEGYTAMITKMFECCDIEMNRKVTAKEMLDSAKHVIWTGPFDEAFDHKHGYLSWRGLHWKWTVSDKQLPAAVVHETSMEVPWVRSMDTSYFNNRFNGQTHIIREYSNSDEAYYPILKPNTDAVLEAYKREAEEQPRISCLGRMGRFKYINMDQAVSDALAFMERHTRADLHPIV
jgi:UDP-galactopyranose mutase